MIDRFDSKEEIDLWRGPFKGAYRKGAEARAKGKPLTACPYDYNLICRGGPTWSRAFARAWRAGWADQDMSEIEQGDLI